MLILEPCSMLLEQRQICRAFGSTNGCAGHRICALLKKQKVFMLPPSHSLRNPL